MVQPIFTPGLVEFFDELERWQREDSPWLYSDQPIEIPPEPVRGRGGKPTGQFKPTGKQAMQQLEMQMGRNATPKGANPKGAGTELPARQDSNEELRRMQQASADAILGPLDAVAVAMERKWGVGRLETLVPEDWAERFQSAAQKLNAAIAGLDLAAIRERAEIMRRGWLKLDELATAAGHEPWQQADVWEVRAPGGRVYAIVRSDMDRRNTAQKDGVATFTLAEVARILEAWDRDGQVSIIKASFPDATVVKAGFIDPADNPETGAFV